MNESNSDLYSPFEPQQFISIRSSGGNIGRLFWFNQRQGSLESWATDPKGPYTKDVWEVFGECQLISNIGDHYAWVFGELLTSVTTNYIYVNCFIPTCL